jgi:hypothetical protein
MRMILDALSCIDAAESTFFVLKQDCPHILSVRGEAYEG